MRPLPSAIALLTLASIRRLLREGLVIRSLIFPVALTTGTEVVTLGVVAITVPDDQVAVPTSWTDDALGQLLATHQITLEPTSDPAGAVFNKEAKAGFDGSKVYTLGLPPELLLVESYLRSKHPESWQIEPVLREHRPQDLPGAGRLISRLVSAIYALYGVVIGAGMIARDRDDGTLAAEFLLPVPRFAIAASRWIAASLVLCGCQIPALFLLDALISVPDLYAQMGHGAAASLTSCAIGLAAIGSSGAKSGFSARLAGALSADFALYLAGRLIPGLAPILPVASLGQASEPWLPLILAALFALGSIFQFQRVNGR